MAGNDRGDLAAKFPKGEAEVRRHRLFSIAVFGAARRLCRPAVADVIARACTHSWRCQVCDCIRKSRSASSWISSATHYDTAPSISSRPACRRGRTTFPRERVPSLPHGVGDRWRLCPDCGVKLPPPKQRLIGLRGKPAPPAAKATSTEHDVCRINYAVHAKRYAAADAPKSMRVDYVHPYRWHSEFVCFEHTGFARRKPSNGWRQRSPLPGALHGGTRRGDRSTAAASPTPHGLRSAMWPARSTAALSPTSSYCASKSIPIAPTADDKENSSNARQQPT